MKILKAKKGEEQESPWLVVMVVVALIGLVIVALLYKSLGGASASGSQEKLCTLSNSIKWALEDKTKVVQVGVSRMCKTQFADIIPDEWGKCNPMFEGEFLKGNKKNSLKACAMEQIADYMLSCWDMNGNGEWKTGNWVCYNLNINSPEDAESALIDAAEAKREIEKEVREKLECGVKVSEPKLEYVRGCEPLVVSVTNLVYDNLLDNNIISYYIDIGKENSTELFNLRADINKNSARMNDLIKEYIGNSEEIGSTFYICNNKVYDCGKNEAGYECSYGSEIIQVGNSAADGCTFRQFTIGENSLQNISLLTSEVPDLIAISESDFKSFLKNYAALSDDNKYVAISSDAIRFLGESNKIKQNTLVSVGFCAGEGELGQGLATRLQCNKATGPEIQVGMERKESPMPGYCASRKLIKMLEAFCQTRREIIYN